MTDLDDFESLYRRHHDDLLRYALRRVEQPADAADIVAETMSVAWRRRHDLPGPDEQRLWLFGVARHALANQRRGRLRQSQLAARLRQELRVHDSARSENDNPVLRALAQLSLSDRDLLAMSAWEGLRPEEIATVLSCTPTAARVRLHRARRRLRAALALEGFHPHSETVPVLLAEETS